MSTIGNFALERSQVEQKWDLTRLIQDLTKIKTSSLSLFEENCLYGLLCRYNLQLIATKLGWSIKALRTELSRGLYTYIKDLLNCHKIIWNKIPDWLESSYGKKVAFRESATAQIEEQYRSKSIVALVLMKQTEECDSKLIISDDTEQEEIHALKNYADLRLRSGDFVEAIKIYTEVIEKDLSYLGVLNKIASCFYKLELYNDVGEISNFLLCHAKLDEIKLVSYNFLGLISRESAIQQYNVLQVNQAIYCFTKAKELSDLDILPAWNLIEVMLQFSKENPNYLERAKLVVVDLLTIAEHPESNFKRYNQRILIEAKVVFANLDKWWDNVYDRIDRLGHD